MAFSAPWVSIQVNGEDGTPTVFVEEHNLQDFPLFMEHIVKNSVGKELGFFKIRILGNSVSSSLDDLLQFVKGSFRLKQGDAKVKVQTICKPSIENEHAYGLREDLKGNSKANKAKKTFLENAFDPSTYSNQTTCCLQLLNKSLKGTVDHYWNEICNNNSNNPLLYGSGIPLEKNSFNVAGSFNLSKLNTVLDLLPVPIPGIAYPYLYVGGPHSSFPWHIEDGAAFSINYLHYGAPCIWFFVPPRSYKQFENSARYFPLDTAQVTCTNVLGHKYILANEAFLKKFDIPVRTVIQQERELIVIFPYTAHSGFRTGHSISEAANFGDPSWVELSLLAPHCSCLLYPDLQKNLTPSPNLLGHYLVNDVNPPNRDLRKDCFKMDLSRIIANNKPNLLGMYSKNDMGGLVKMLGENPYIKDLNLLPAQCVPSESNSAHIASSSRSIVPEVVPMHDGDLRSKKSKAKISEESEMKLQKERLILKCPGTECKTTYTGGIGRMHRLISHIHKDHGGEQNLLNELKVLYPEKVTCKGLLCLVCGEVKAGNSYHLKLHMKRKHSM